tara:strand:+ start:1183 stop:1314 length:132 start_codon:yes stop_codon:yes gene_type:complete
MPKNPVGMGLSAISPCPSPLNIIMSSSFLSDLYLNNNVLLLFV